MSTIRRQPEQDEADLSVEQSCIVCVKCGALLKVPEYKSDPAACMAVLEHHMAGHECRRYKRSDWVRRLPLSAAR